jgi:hypothetical protein
MWPLSNTSSSGRTPSSCELAAGREVHAAAVERADLGQQLHHVRQALLGADHVGDIRVGWQRLWRAKHQIAAHPTGQVHHHVDIGAAHPPHHLPVEGDVARAAAAVGIADVDVGDGRPRPRGLDRGVRDLRRRDRDAVAATGVVAGAGHRAGDEHLLVHAAQRSTVAWSKRRLVSAFDQMPCTQGRCNSTDRA